MNQAPTIPSKVFSALNGSEIIDIITKQIRTAMEADDTFQPHITFPVVEAEFTLTFRSYPGRNSVTPIILDIPLKAQGVGELPQLGEPVTGEFKGELITDAPDEERIKHGLPVTRPELSNGRFVDKPMVEKPMPEIPRMED